MPLETAECRGRCTGFPLVQRWCESRKPETFVVRPGSKVRHAQAGIDGQSRCNLPGILNETLHCVIGNIVDAIEIRLSEARKVAGEQIGISVTARKVHIIRGN